MHSGIKLYDAIAEPVLTVIDNLWPIALPVIAVVIVVVIILRVLRKRNKAKKKDE